jgi:hypothetical protein
MGAPSNIFKGVIFFLLIIELTNYSSISLTSIINSAVLAPLYTVLKPSIISSFISIIYVTKSPTGVLLNSSSFTDDIESFGERITAQATVIII